MIKGKIENLLEKQIEESINALKMKWEEAILNRMHELIISRVCHVILEWKFNWPNISVCASILLCSKQKKKLESGGNCQHWFASDWESQKEVKGTFDQVNLQDWFCIWMDGIKQKGQGNLWSRKFWDLFCAPCLFLASALVLELCDRLSDTEINLGKRSSKKSTWKKLEHLLWSSI
jgi:hypothetical protein